MDRPNRYQPVTHDQIVERLTRVVERWRAVHAEAERLAEAERDARAARVHAPEHTYDG